MSRDEDKLIRQLSLVAFLLSRPRPFTAREIQQSVEGYADMSDDTFTRRFYADRTDLAKVGIDIRVVEDPTGLGDRPGQAFLLTEEDFHLPQVEFTGPELQALSVALAALDGRFAYARPLRLALTAIFQGHKHRVHDELDDLPVALAPDEDAVRAGRQLAHLEEAVARRKTVRFLYPTGQESAAHRERTVDPYSLFFTQGHWYLVGHDHDRNAIRTFRLTRIKGHVRYTTEKASDFSVPPDYDPAAYRARPPWLLGPVRGSATVRVNDELAWLVERLAPHVRVVDSDDVGCSHFVVSYADEDMLLSWVVGLGSCGELLGPPGLRQRLAELLADICRKHSDGPEAGEPEPGEPEQAGPEAAGTETWEPGLLHLAAKPAGATNAQPRIRGPEASAPGTQYRPGPIAPERIARAVTLVNYLLREDTPHLIPWKTLTNDLGLARHEIEEDLSLLNLVNFGGGTYALCAQARPDGVYVEPDVMAGTFGQPARLSPLMARSLLLALDLLGEALRVPGLESLSSVRRKVEALVGPLNAPASVFVDEVSPTDPELLERLNEAIQERYVLELEYYTPTRGELTRRRVEPYLLFRNPDGWYLEAYCLAAEAQRTFKLERIRSAIATGERFAPRPGVDLSLRRQGRAFLPDRATCWADVRFDSRWRRHLEDVGLPFKVLAGGGLRARVPYTDEGWLVKFVLRYLGQAVLERPADLRTKVGTAAALLARRYATADTPSAAGGPA